MQRRLDFDYRNKRIGVTIEAGRDLVLWLNGVERKRRTRGEADCLYVWTNVELEWEEHHFIEARWWPESDRLRVSANGRELFDGAVS